MLCAIPKLQIYRLLRQVNKALIDKREIVKNVFFH